MDAIRCQLIGDVEDAVKAGEVTSFWQYLELLQPYDDHDPLAESMGSVPTCAYDESGAHADVCLGEDIADEGPLDDAIDQETKAFDKN